MDIIEMIEELDRPNPARKICRDRTNPFEVYSDQEFKERFRFNKHTTELLLDLIRADIDHGSQRNCYIPPILQITVALRFFATGQFQLIDGDLINISQPSACRIVNRVSHTIARKKSHFIKLPSDVERQHMKQQFRAESGIPGVIGCIDCSHVPIISPGGDNAELFRNRKGYFSINVQAVTDPDMRFINIVCRWPGSTHDSRIFDNSALCAMLENNTEQGILLGDGGYPCRRYLLTPVPNPTTRQEKQFNKAHIKTRGKIERMFGIWKQRFRCLRTPLRLKLQITLTVIVATACLHNFALNNGDFLEESETVDNDTCNFNSSSNASASSTSGTTTRQQIISNLF